MSELKLLTTGEIKLLAASIPAHVPDDTAVCIEVDEEHLKIKSFWSKTIIVLTRSLVPITVRKTATKLFFNQQSIN